MKAIIDISLIIISIYLMYLFLNRKRSKISESGLGNLTYKIGETETFFIEDTKTYASVDGKSLFGYMLKNGKAYEALYLKNARILFQDRENCSSVLVFDNKSFDYHNGYLKPVFVDGLVSDFEEASAFAKNSLNCIYWKQNYGTEENPNFKYNFISVTEEKTLLTVWNFRTETPGYQVIPVHKQENTWTEFSPAKETAYRGNQSGHKVNVNSFDTINNQKIYKMNYSDAK